MPTSDFCAGSTRKAATAGGKNDLEDKGYMFYWWLKQPDTKSPSTLSLLPWVIVAPGPQVQLRDPNAGLATFVSLLVGGRNVGLMHRDWVFRKEDRNLVIQSINGQRA